VNLESATYNTKEEGTQNKVEDSRRNRRSTLKSIYRNAKERDIEYFQHIIYNN